MLRWSSRTALGCPQAQVSVRTVFLTNYPMCRKVYKHLSKLLLPTMFTSTRIAVTPSCNKLVEGCTKEP